MTTFAQRDRRADAARERLRALDIADPHVRESFITFVWCCTKSILHYRKLGLKSEDFDAALLRAIDRRTVAWDCTVQVLKHGEAQA
jgi:hypothetical protein